MTFWQTVLALLVGFWIKEAIDTVWDFIKYARKRIREGSIPPRK